MIMGPAIAESSLGVIASTVACMGIEPLTAGE